MNAAAIPVPAWWLIATVTTAVFLMTLVSWMPTKRLKARMILVPVGMAAFATTRYCAEGMLPEQALSMYSLVVLAFPLGLLGRRQELARSAANEEQGGLARESQWSIAMTVQFLVVLLAAIGLWLWLI
ncbi:hypothetical protein OG594_35825 [Streptomyces sp. NBC_01214]|uniref:hypothetical protein n=1 Tax=Streptomyces sp. NBC_01214 TaxID=2903777 RepID=UPI002256FACA|nr:hypothetical protein [Streptomyces sp. NBC_01214]MCX4806932.1 hypothetical protein [Streptomyces sp. NBC_01214]